MHRSKEKMSIKKHLFDYLLTCNSKTACQQSKLVKKSSLLYWYNRLLLYIIKIARARKVFLNNWKKLQKFQFLLFIFIIKWNSKGRIDQNEATENVLFVYYNSSFYEHCTIVQAAAYCTLFSYFEVCTIVQAAAYCT